MAEMRQWTKKEQNRDLDFQIVQLKRSTLQHE